MRAQSTSVRVRESVRISAYKRTKAEALLAQSG